MPRREEDGRRDPLGAMRRAASSTRRTALSAAPSRKQLHRLHEPARAERLPSSRGKCITVHTITGSVKRARLKWLWPMQLWPRKGGAARRVKCGTFPACAQSHVYTQFRGAATRAAVTLTLVDGDGGRIDVPLDRNLAPCLSRMCLDTRA